MEKRLVIALGGNAIIRPGERGTVEEQRRNVALTCRQVAAVMSRGYQVVLTHGNGPQVGNILIQNEEARSLVPPMPLDVCGAQSQGQIGYMLQSELARELASAGMNVPVVTVVTQVVVDPADPAFQDPSKPVGPFYTEQRAKRIMEGGQYVMKEDAHRGWRRVVPSPEPRALVEERAIRLLVDAGVLVIASGGGGIPVRRVAGGWEGVEAVVDKDLTGQKLARLVEAEGFLILTDVDRVFIHHKTEREQPLDRVSTGQARRYMEEGHFAAGSMLPKVEAAVRFAERGGYSIITALDRLSLALEGRAGTTITKEV
ncbi:MAG TPA: carbamate kinase [Clostridiales bacterium UBA8153]|nr:carbamate kinase [Clostridiales bacterium UBA8153]